MSEFKISIVPLSLYSVATQINSLISSNLSTVFSPIGIPQTLALLYLVSQDLQPEIEQFVSAGVCEASLVDQITSLNYEFSKINCFIPDLNSKKEFIFTNNLYAILSDSLHSNQSQFGEMEAIGAHMMSMNFADSQTSVNKINEIVNHDTNGKISRILNSDDVDSRTVSVFLLTIYIKASWKFVAKSSCLNFIDSGLATTSVKSFTHIQHVKVIRKNGIDFVSLPTIEDGWLLIRHDSNPNNCEAITTTEIKDFQTNSQDILAKVTVPNVTLKVKHDLQALLAQELPKTLTNHFQTNLSEQSMEISKFIQLVTFEMSENGLEASAATALVMRKRSCVPSLQIEPLTININSAFSFVLIKTINSIDYPLFSGHINSFNDLIMS